MKKSVIVSIILLVFFIILVIFAYFKFFDSTPGIPNNTKSNVSVFNIGLVTSNQSDINRYQSFIDFCNANSRFRWYLTPLKNNGDFINKIQEGRLQGGFAGSFVMMELIKSDEITPIFRPVKNGVTHYSGAIIVRKDRGISKLEDLRGKRFAFTDPFTSSGYLTAIEELKKIDVDPDNFFGAMAFLGSFENVAKAVSNGEFDAGALKKSVWDKYAFQNASSSAEVYVLKVTGKFPESTFFLSKNAYSPEVLDDINKILNKIRNTDEGSELKKKFDFDSFDEANSEEYVELTNEFDVD